MVDCLDNIPQIEQLRLISENIRLTDIQHVNEIDENLKKLVKQNNAPSEASSISLAELELGEK